MWETVIGLEVHAQLKTHSKLFSNAPTLFGAPPNSQTNYIDAGLPGVLPVLNARAVHMAIQFGLAIDAEINDLSFFERKNYFYPDLPKGYQISQFQRPIVSNGHLAIQTQDNQTKLVTIERAHLEEDAGKSLHDAMPAFTGIDLNRAGIPLLEIVTTPCMFSANEAICYLKNLHQLLRFLDICDGNMQEGSFRCDVNISLRPLNSQKLGTRTELKNLNSFRFIEKAIAYEQRRHQDLLESGQVINQQTRLYCSDTNTTRAMRDKEDENDYRYFPDPDLLPIKITAHDIATIKSALPELPAAIRLRLIHEGVSDEDIDFILSSTATFHFFESIKNASHASTKMIVNWLRGTYQAALNEQGRSFDTPLITADKIACLLDKLTDNLISTTNAKRIFAKLLTSNETVDDLIATGDYQQLDNSSIIEGLIITAIQNHPQQAADYRAGKEKLLSFFVGQVMKQAKGAADPADVSALLQKHLSNEIME